MFRSAYMILIFILFTQTAVTHADSRLCHNKLIKEQVAPIVRDFGGKVAASIRSSLTSKGLTVTSVKIAAGNIHSGNNYQGILGVNARLYVQATTSNGKTFEAIQTLVDRDTGRDVSKVGIELWFVSNQVARRDRLGELTGYSCEKIFFEYQWFAFRNRATKTHLPGALSLEDYDRRWQYVTLSPSGEVQLTWRQ